MAVREGALRRAHDEHTKQNKKRNETIQKLGKGGRPGGRVDAQHIAPINNLLSKTNIEKNKKEQKEDEDFFPRL